MYESEPPDLRSLLTRCLHTVSDLSHVSSHADERLDAGQRARALQHSSRELDSAATRLALYSRSEAGCEGRRGRYLVNRSFGRKSDGEYPHGREPGFCS